MEQENCSESDERIIQNVQQAYLSRLNDSAKRLRQIERDHLDKMSKLYGVQGEVKLPQRSDLDVVEENRLKAASSPNKNAHTLEEISFDQAENKFDSGQAILMKQEIEKIVGQMNNLSDLFRDVSNLVVEQGTVLDRIDFHIQDARGNVKKGNKDL